MRKKIIGIFVIMLMISSAMTTILLSSDNKVKASGGQQGSSVSNLPYDYVWSMVENFSNVIHNVNWSEGGENGIPKGRSWATAGENYTRDNILWPNMGVPNNPCGLTGYTNLTIGYIPNSYEPPVWKHILKNYSSKIVIKDCNLTIKNNSQLVKYLQPSEFFPIGVGCIPIFPLREHTINYLNQTFTFTNANIKEPFLWPDHHNVSCDHTNDYTDIGGPVVYLNSTDPIPENQDCIFILNEDTSVKDKLDNLSNSMGCVLIEDNTGQFSAPDYQQYNFSIVKVNEANNDFSLVLSQIKNGSNYSVDNLENNEILVFSNYSNTSCGPQDDYVFAVQLSYEDEYYKLLIRTACWQMYPHCKGVIMSSYENHTYVMTHTVRDWGWFGSLGKKYYKNRYSLPIFSVNKTIGKYIIDNKNTVTVNGFLDQVYRRQTTTSPGVISHNVIAYRNITHSPNNAIVVLSNRMDGWFSETPGDAGNAGAVLLGIAKYFNDNDITPKYNLTFLFTTGEEYGMRGAQHFVDSHPNGTGQNEYNFIHWIGFEQFGFNYTLSDSRITFNIITKNVTMRKLIYAIANQTNYVERTGHHYNFSVLAEPPDGGGENYVWQNNCPDTILFEKDSVWNGHHQTGENYTKGDSLNYIDRNDVNTIFELTWNVTKYFTVWPNCRFDAINYEKTSVTNGLQGDSLKATFTVKSTLPSDLVMVNASLWNDNGNQYTGIRKIINFTTNRSGVEQQIILTMPQGTIKGNFYIKLKLYNSTGRINKIINPSNDQYNQTITSPRYHLYQWDGFGNNRRGSDYLSVENMMRGSPFTMKGQGTAKNITAYVWGFYNTPTYKCMIYYNTGNHSLVATTEEKSLLQPGWNTFSFEDPPVLYNGTKYNLIVWGQDDDSRLYYDNDDANSGCYRSWPYGDPPSSLIFFGESKLYSVFCSFTPETGLPTITNVSNTPETVGYGYNVTITASATDALSNIDYCTVKIVYPDSSTDNFTMTHLTGNQYQYIFSDTSLLGTYDYTIWAVDNSNNRNSSSGHHFHVSANATISVCTIKNSYGENEYINITDPPEGGEPGLPPSSEGSSVIARGLTWNLMRSQEGSYRYEGSMEPVNYLENHVWKPINTNITGSETPDYDYQVTTGLYQAYFKENPTEDDMVHVAYTQPDNLDLTASLDLQPYELLWRNHDNQMQPISMVRNVTGYPVAHIWPSEHEWHHNLDTMLYPNIFGYGTNLTLEYSNSRLSKKLWVNPSDLPAPLINRSGLTLDLVFKLAVPDSLSLWLNNERWNASVVTVSNDTVVLRNNGVAMFSFVRPFAFEKFHWTNDLPTQAMGRLTYEFRRMNGECFVVVRTPASFVFNESLRGPIMIDPTVEISIGQSSDDAADKPLLQSKWSFDTDDWWYWLGNADNFKKYVSGWRFQQVFLDDSCTIVSGSFTLSTWAVYGGGVGAKSKCYGFNTSNPGTWVVTTNEPRNASKTHEFSDMIVRSSDVPNGIYVPRSFNVTDIVKELLMNDSWVSGNNMSFICMNNGTSIGSTLSASTFDASESYPAPKLIIEFNHPPEISSPYPANGTINVSLTPQVHVSVNDSDNDTMTVSWYWGNSTSNCTHLFDTNCSVGNGTYCQNFSNATVNGRWWYWKVVVDDGYGTNTSGYYRFFTGTESKIKNTGSTNIKGYLLVQVQGYNQYSGWIPLVDVVHNTTPTIIMAGGELGFDQYFNDCVRTNTLLYHGYSPFRVYAAFTSANGDVLKGLEAGSALEATWEFTITAS